MTTFPAIKTADLDRRKVVLPDDLAGRTNLVVVAYERDQQSDVDSWSPTLEDLERIDAGFRWHELPVVGERGRTFRLMLDNGMRMGIRDRTTRARVFTLYVDPVWFRQALDLDDESNIALVLLDGDAEVRWTGYGAHRPETEHALRTAIAGLRP